MLCWFGMNGLLLIDKPLNWTSFDVVNKVRRLIEQSGFRTGNKKRFPVGHTGTLDPLATGLLVLVLGEYCKRATEFSKLDKTYETVMRLGINSSTGDEEGEKTSVSDVRPMPEDIAFALSKFTGDIMQTPPAFSAMKVNGQRAYKLARSGQAVELAARPTRIESLELTGYEYPNVHFTAHVGSGTYIRSLVEDIGKHLGTGAYMSGLRRTKVGAWKLDDALSMEDISAEQIAQVLREAPE